MARPRTKLTVEAVRTHKLQGKWVIAGTGDGRWLARLEDELLFAMNGSKPRTFATLDAAVRRLNQEIGVSRFEIEAQPA